MNSKDIRNAFFEFFASKNHHILPSAPMVVKNDPTLMFTNAGMNQFKDIFLGNTAIKYPRIANTQKCLRVSGKHNDLEEVGLDTYHHTMFEMLGNWSFGDYFKEEAIGWAYEFLVKVMKLPVDRLYSTVFEGSNEDQLNADNEAFDIWKKYFPEQKILFGSKKDNFWEMGESGPCGPCSEIHIDLRNENDRKKTDGKLLVNTGHPLVIEIWNLVFIQYNRKSDGSLEPLPHKHVDTGMGFERLCMAVQHKQSNYDTDIFVALTTEISALSGMKYGNDNHTDIAMRVIADHLRAISFSIADGQLPSNNKAGYVIRRILRRAVRYGFTFLNQSEPFIYKLVPSLISVMGDTFPELKAQQELIEKVIMEEEHAFLRTLETGIKRLNLAMNRLKEEGQNLISGKEAFDLYDTYGFPVDLTELILKEQGFMIDKIAFSAEMDIQKNRSRAAGALTTDDWVIIREAGSSEFTGYDRFEDKSLITRYRKVISKGQVQFQLVFDRTPFYAESGGQVGDCGEIRNDGETIAILDTKKENNLIIHISGELPSHPEDEFTATVNKEARLSIMNNHTATHLLHFALRKILGTHVEQKGSLVDAEHLRFDFSHFQKLTDEELIKTEHMVNELIRTDNRLEEYRSIPISKANEMGAMALFGEKYGDTVRVIRFGESVELCGGTHVQATGRIGYFRIISESAIATGIRRIEAITGFAAEQYMNDKINLLKEIGNLFKNPQDLRKSIENLLEENNGLIKQIEFSGREKIMNLKTVLISKVQKINGMNVIIEKVDADDADGVKDLAFRLRNELADLFLVLGAEINGNAHLTVIISDNLVSSRNLHAGKIVGEIAGEVNGRGGGQAFYATAGGKTPDGIRAALNKAIEIISKH
ncbi:MAG: alanine--tRNA ligase [Bacteroidia bacterium]|nr:alanine--tRNA ligase [Bacteroidia bacterium]